MNKFTYRRSVLNIAVLVWMILGIIFLVEHSEDIGNESGQGMSISLIWVGVAMVGIIIDLLLQYFMPKRKIVNIIEGVIVIGVIVFLKTYLIV